MWVTRGTALRRRYRWSLRARLLAVVLLALLPIALLLSFLWLSARERDREDTLQTLAQVTEAVAVIADDLFDEGITVGQTLAADQAIKQMLPARFTPHLRELRARSPHLANIAIIDMSGTVRGWALPDPLPDPPPTVANRPFFARVTGSGQPTTMRVVNPAAELILGNGVAVPVFGQDGTLTAVIAITFDPDHISRRLGQIRLFPGQLLSLIDPNGRVAVVVGAANRTLDDLTWEQRDRSMRPEVQAALAGQLITSSTYRSPVAPPEAEPRLAVFAPTPRHGWVVSATWSSTQALGPTWQAQQHELLIFMAIVLVIVGGALVASRGMITPLRRLAEHARALGDGRFEPITDITSDDEIGDLAATLDVMGQRLKRTLDDLRQERTRLTVILDHLPVGVVIRSAPHGELVFANEQAERIWRREFRTDGSADRYSIGAAFDADGRPYGQGAWPISRALATGEEVRGEQLTIERGDGTRATIVVSSAPIRDVDGEIIAAISSFDDITAQRETESRLRTREEMLRALVDQFPGAVGVLDRELRYVLAAGRPLEDRTRSREDLIGACLTDVYPAENVARARPFYDRALAGETVAYDTVREGRAIRITITPLRNVDGAVEHILTVAFDVTEERERLEKLARDEKLHALGQMASGIAHNLNQTLALVSGYGELAHDVLDHSPPNLDELRRMLRIVERAAYDGGETVKRLLTFSRGQENERHEPIDVAELLHEVGQLTAPRWRESSRVEGRPVELQVHAASDLTVVGSQASLRESLTNLVFNALDAMPEGGTILLRAHAEASTVVIEVQDTGVGMTPDVRRRIFEPFFTTKGEQGTGLGLAMVFGIIRHHAGQIDVTSSPGQGTTIRLTLPAGTPVAGSPAGGGDEQPARSLRVLVVDDEPRLTALAAGMLRRDGHQATEAFSADEALQRLRAEPFDLVISDLSMGDGMNGWELAATMDQVAPGLPVVLATGWGAAIDEADARSRGVAAVLAKPFRIAELRDAVARAMVPPDEGQAVRGEGRAGPVS
jgi:signal transduction histidine kinase/ActR/RegA family two-component response regulator/HAMP domain-containing protein